MRQPSALPTSSQSRTLTTFLAITRRQQAGIIFDICTFSAERVKEGEMYSYYMNKMMPAHFLIDVRVSRYKTVDL